LNSIGTKCLLQRQPDTGLQTANSRTKEEKPHHKPSATGTNNPECEAGGLQNHLSIRGEGGGETERRNEHHGESTTDSLVRFQMGLVESVNLSTSSYLQ
jgi:hypothetical protein